MNKIISGIIIGVASGVIINLFFSEDKKNKTQIINNQQIINSSNTTNNSNNSTNIVQSNSQSININYNSNK